MHLEILFDSVYVLTGELYSAFDSNCNTFSFFFSFGRHKLDSIIDMLKMEVETNTKQLYSVMVFKHNFIAACLWSYINHKTGATIINGFVEVLV